MEIRDSAAELSEHGIKIKGVTAWALLGSFDWDTLLTKTGTQYESGVFDIKTFPGRLRPTALADLIKYLTTRKGALHPVLSEKGWWHNMPYLKKNLSQPIIITGDIAGQKENEETNSTGLIIVLQDACRQRRIPYRVINKFSAGDIEKINPWAVINTGGVNKNIRLLCLQKKLRYVSFSPGRTGHVVH